MPARQTGPADINGARARPILAAAVTLLALGSADAQPEIKSAPAIMQVITVYLPFPQAQSGGTCASTMHGSTTIDDGYTDTAQDNPPGNIAGTHVRVPPVGSAALSITLKFLEHRNTVDLTQLKSSTDYVRAKEVLAVSGEIFEDGYRKFNAGKTQIHYFLCPVTIGIELPSAYSFALSPTVQWTIPPQPPAGIVIGDPNWATWDPTNKAANFKARQQQYADAEALIALSERLYLQSLP